MTGAAFSVSQTGELVYQTGTASTASRLVWLNRQGDITSVVAGNAEYGDLFMSADGRFASVSRAESGAASARDIWIIDTMMGRPRKFTVDPGNELEAVWSFAGEGILYNSNRKGFLNLYTRSASGGGTEQELVVDNVNKYPQGWSPDGQYIIYMTFGETTRQDLWLLPLRTRKPEPLLRTEFDEGGGQFSPGRWITYWARGYVWIMPFQRPGGPWQVSDETGGTFPRWTRNGREILYLSGSTIMSTAVNCAGETCEVETAKRLFRRTYRGPGRWSYAVSPDGQRILALTSEGKDSLESTTLHVNWPTGLSAGN
jgi:Tol biopolymer transport system component